MPPAVGYAVAGITTLLSTRAAAGANRDAAREEAQATGRALEAEIEDRAYRRGIDEDERAYTRGQDELSRADRLETRDYDRGQSANYLERLNPYVQGGYGATSRLSGLLGGGGGATVRLRAPTGEERDVPAGQAEQYVARGAQRI